MRRLIAALTMVIGLTALGFAQTPGTSNMDILRQKLKADKKLVIAENLKLTDAEGGKVLAGLRRLPEGPPGYQPAARRRDQCLCRRV